MKWVTRALVALFVLLCLGAAAGFAAFKWFETQIEADGPLPSEEAQTVFVPNGAGVIRIGQQLENEGLISDARLFRLAASYLQLETSLKAGEYLIPPKASMVDILNLMSAGDVILHSVQIIEGSTIAQAMAVIAASDILTGDMPDTPAEGRFLPDTYFFTRGTSRRDAVAHLIRAQDDLMTEIWETRQADLPLASIEEAIVLASIVEKETGSVGDEDLVAGVFINRLNRGMRLQSDPTIIYGISQGERLTRTVNGQEVQRGLYRSEIDRYTPYNTYQIDGLPPTPICNPSEAALRAVLQPAESDYLFFVADGTGRHAFARTNAEHNRNVARWREIERQRRAGQ